MNIFLFTPEHDLCLANGDLHYVPPESALCFADECAGIMRYMYGPEAHCLSARQFVQMMKEDEVGRAENDIIAWGWTETLRTYLLSAGVAEVSIPGKEDVLRWRQLQHRSTSAGLLAWLSRQTGSPYPVEAVTDLGQLQALRERYGALVLKAPWSGSGRGLHWLWPVDSSQQKTDSQSVGAMPATPNTGEEDRLLTTWFNKIVAHQDCVMAEPWLSVLQDFAMEFYIGDVPAVLHREEMGKSKGCDPEVSFLGYSLFECRAGVYAENLLLTDEDIESRLGEYIPVAQLHHIRLLLAHWLTQNVLPYYHGPLGVDMFIHDSTRGPRLRPVSEINFRHTMGLVAHEYLRHHPADNGKHFAIRYVANRRPSYLTEVS